MSASYGPTVLVAHLATKSADARAGLLATGLAMALIGCTDGPQRRPEGASQAVQGAGASFPAPLYQRWFSHLTVREGLALAYVAEDSGQGVNQLLAGLLDFAGSDRDANTGMDPRLQDATWLRIPTTAGAIAVAYNHRGCRLKLTRAQLRAIVAGRIHDYHQLGCQPMRLSIWVRSDTSGSTAHLLHYLQLPPRQWHGSTVRSVSSPAAMATALSRTPGAIGLLDTVYLHGRSSLQAAALENAAGRYVRPEGPAVAFALAQDEQAPAAYPISTFSWLVMRRRGLGEKAMVLKQALRYGLSPEGQAEAKDLGYQPLPEPMRRRALHQLENLQP